MKNTTLCYIEKDGQYLMLHRVGKKKDLNENKWIGVGGKIEKGETATDGAIREIKEETGLDAIEIVFRGIVNFKSDIWEEENMYLYSVYDFKGEIIECDEGNLEWIDKKELFNLTLWEGDKIFLKLIDSKETPPFYLELSYSGDDLIYSKLEGNYNFEGENI